MKILLSTLLLVQGAALGGLTGIPVEPAHAQQIIHVASASGMRDGAMGGGKGQRKGPGSLSEQTLFKALELPGAEPVPAGKSPDVFDEFELKVSDYLLPASDIPLTMNSKVEYFINLFQDNGRGWFAKWLSRSERYIPMMKNVLRENGLPEDLVYMAMIESGFSSHAQSHANAVGPWQFIAGTGKRYSLRIDKWIDERRDPLKSTVAAALYLKDLYSIFNKDWYLAAAGYNAGENKILRAIGMYNSSDFWQLTEGSYLKRETKDYVPKLLAAAIIAKEPVKYGFADVAYLPPIEFDAVTIPSRTDLDLVARLLNIPVGILKELNPELRQGCTPPDYPDYQLKLPKGTGTQFLDLFDQVPEGERYAERVTYRRHTVRRGDTLEGVARRYGSNPEEIMTLNRLDGRRLVRGRTLRVPLRRAGASPHMATTGAVTAGKASSKNTVRYYTIKRGDTLTSIAKRFKIPSRTLAVWNNIRRQNALQPGTKLIVARLVEIPERELSRSGDQG